jgi:hypothetical protein
MAFLIDLTDPRFSTAWNADGGGADQPARLERWCARAMADA